MAESSGFFNAHLVNGEYDRVYLAESFAKYFASFIANGVFGGKSNELMVQQKSTADMSVRVLSGQAWINGYWYENDNELSLAIDVADGVLNRIDLIVLRWDNAERVIRLAVKKGTPATNASAPIIQRNADYFELKLAEVYVKAGATRITQIDITDTRLREDVCGLVVGVVQQLDTQEFGKQLGEYVDNFIKEFDIFEKTTIADIEAWKDEIEDSYNNWFTQFKANSNSSFNTFMTENQAKVNKLLTDGQTNINKVISDGQTNIGNVVSKGTTDINNLITTKTNEVNAVISNGEQRFNESMAELEEIKQDNDLTVLYRKVTRLDGLFVESNTNPGCFYRITSTGETEWVNPPSLYGVEYRTTERWNGNAIYQRIIYAAALPNKTVMSVHVNAYFDEIISIAGFAIDSDNNMHYEFPIILNGLTPVAVISFAEGDGGAGSDITINTNDDLTSFKAYITVKYTKTK